VKILFDHQAFTIQEYGGISRYFHELISRFDSVNNQQELSLKYSKNAYLENKKPLLDGFNFRGKQRLFYYLNKRYSIEHIKKQRFDVFHPTYYDPYFFKYIGNKPFVVTFLDMIHEKFMQAYPELANDSVSLQDKRLMAQKAARLIAISQSTKNDMVKILGVTPDKIDVVYLGTSFNASITSDQSFYDFKYLLYVGTRRLYKNFDFFLKSISPLLAAANVKLVCAGGGKFSPSEQNLIKELGLEEYVIFSEVNDLILANLYKHAEAFVFPSLYEGFGIPVLEAFACDCPCVISNVSSLPEVGGDAALYFDPKNAESIINSIKKVLCDDALRTSLTLAGKEQLKKFSWDKTYEKTIAVYNSVF
jgi:glycosyltransferase involved in cell wall biosynthesis